MHKTKEPSPLSSSSIGAHEKSSNRAHGKKQKGIVRGGAKRGAVDKRQNGVKFGKVKLYAHILTRSVEHLIYRVDIPKSLQTAKK